MSKIKFKIVDLIILIVFIVGGSIPMMNSLINFLDLNTGIWNLDYLVTSLMNFRFFVLRDKIYNGVLVGEGDWLNYIGESSLDDFQNTIPFSESQLAEIQTKLDNFRGMLEKQNIKFYVVIPPNKNTIYPEKLSSYLPYVGEESRLTQVVDYQREHGSVQIIDLREELIRAKEKSPSYYFTDSHWTPYGAWVAYYKVAGLIGQDFPDISPHQLKDYEIVSKPFESGDLSQMAGNIAISEDVLFLCPKFEENIKITDEIIGQKKITIAENIDENLPRALIYRDSFFIALIPLLSDHFSYAYIVKSFDYDENLIQAEKPDLVIIEVSERYIHKLLNLP